MFLVSSAGVAGWEGAVNPFLSHCGPAAATFPRGEAAIGAMFDPQCILSYGHNNSVPTPRS